MTNLPRLKSVDTLRGLLMVLMAIDHVRVYSGIPAGGTDPAVFFTRWITHFCAPGFVFLAGLSAFLYGQKLGHRSLLFRYLFTRGLVLAALELTLLRWSWTFQLPNGGFLLAGVIWMLGWSMVWLALLIRLSPRVIGGLGVAIILFQQAFALLPDWLPPDLREWIGPVWAFVYPTSLPAWSGITVLYVLVPWCGVMAAGYGFGALLAAARRTHRDRSLCWGIGLSATGLFLLIGSWQLLVQPTPPDALPFLLRLLNQRKYPASGLYLLMTLGPLLALMPWAEQARGWLSDRLVIFGRVPLFYYLLHIPLIHSMALLVNLIRTGHMHGEWYQMAPFVAVPTEQQWSLIGLYSVFILTIGLLYWACRWYEDLKATHPQRAWLRYL